jgi:hypothetical protein
MTAIWELPTNISRKHKKAIRSTAGQWSRTALNDISPESNIRRFNPYPANLENMVSS